MAPSELGAYQTITGSGLPSKSAHGGLIYDQVPCPHANVEQKITILQVSPVKSWGCKMTGWTRTPPWTQRKQYCRIFIHGFLKDSFEPCNCIPSPEECRATFGEERLHKCSWVEYGKYCSQDHKKSDHKPQGRF